jgi:hypothetical protein
MDALLTLGRTGTVITAEQLGIYRVLLNHTGRREFKAYLDHGCWAAPAARTLGVHINTLYQRIAVLDRLLGPDWRHPPRSLDLHVLLRVFPNPDPSPTGRNA